jgi:hypothetical protein
MHHVSHPPLFGHRHVNNVHKCYTEVSGWQVFLCWFSYQISVGYGVTVFINQLHHESLLRVTICSTVILERGSIIIHKNCNAVLSVYVTIYDLKCSIWEKRGLMLASVIKHFFRALQFLRPCCIRSVSCWAFFEPLRTTSSTSSGWFWKLFRSQNDFANVIGIWNLRFSQCWKLILWRCGIWRLTVFS